MRYMSVWVKPWELSDHLCECGCGEFTYLATKNFAPRGWVMGEPLRFLMGHATRHRAQLRRERCPEGSPSDRVCACGCGERTPFDRNARPRRFVPGHRLPRPRAAKQLELPKVRPDKLLQYSIDKNGCWVWAGAVDKSGYPRWSNGQKVKAHRASYERHKGPIPAGYHIHHECRNRLCINPAHLTALSQDEHTLVHLVERNGAEWVTERVA